MAKCSHISYCMIIDIGNNNKTELKFLSDSHINSKLLRKLSDLCQMKEKQSQSPPPPPHPHVFFVGYLCLSSDFADFESARTEIKHRKKFDLIKNIATPLFFQTMKSRILLTWFCKMHNLCSLICIIQV